MTSRVLVIDDSTTLRKLVEISMRGSGVDVDFAATGSDGIVRARSVRPDVILLDYLLPDLPSVEVCQRLADDQTTAQVPIVVMSANQSSVFSAFQRFAAVVGFVGKPFSPTEIRTRLESAMRGPVTKGTPKPRAHRGTMRPVTEPVAPQLSPTELAIATQGIVAAIAPRLAELRTAELPTNAADLASFYANLFGPDAIRSIAASFASKGVETQPTDGDLHLRGDLMTTPLLEILRLLTSGSSTGTLVIHLTDTFWIHVRRGGILMCTTSRYDGSSLGSMPSNDVPPELVQRARSLQRAEGKPALITLAQGGGTRVDDLPAELHALGGRLLTELLGTTAGRFVWQPALSLPDYVDAFGRHLSITTIALARERQSPDLVLPSVFLDEVYDRTPRFSAKLGGARLDNDERRLLGLIDGRYTVREILGRAELSTDRAAAIFSRLRNVDLIRSEAMSGVVDIAGGAVVVLDPDEEGFIAPLRAHLARRPQPIEVISLDPAHELAVTMLKLQPRLVVINGNLITTDFVTRELVPISRAGTIGLAAVLDCPDPLRLEAMLEAGVHAVLTKPIHINEIERLISL